MDAVPLDGVSRAVVMEATIAQLRERPLHLVSLDSVAAALGVRRGTVGMQFPTWEALLEAVVSEWNSRRLAPLLPIAGERGVVAFLRAVNRSNAADPAFLRLLIGVANIAAYPGTDLAAWLSEQYLAFYRLVAISLQRDIEDGRETIGDSVERAAEQLVALYEGLSLQSLVRTRWTWSPPSTPQLNDCAVGGM